MLASPSGESINISGPDGDCKKESLFPFLPTLPFPLPIGPLLGLIEDDMMRGRFDGTGSGLGEGALMRSHFDGGLGEGAVMRGGFDGTESGPALKHALLP